MQERWERIDEFPTYNVSDQGRVINNETKRILKLSTNSAHIVKVGLVSAGMQYSRAVGVLVSEAFVDGWTPSFNTPVHLNGDSQDNYATNLMWRPRSFAWKHKRQFVNVTIHHTRGPIRDAKTGEEYTTMLDAAIHHGLLVSDIWRSVLSQRPTFPTWQVFEMAK